MSFPGGSVVKNPPANAVDTGWILGPEDPLEEEIETHSSILARKIPWTEEPAVLQSITSQSQTWLSNWAPTQIHCAVLWRVTQSCLILCDRMDCSPPGSSVHGDSPGKNNRVGCHALLHGNLLNPGIKPRPPAMQVDSYCLSHQGNPESTLPGVE